MYKATLMNTKVKNHVLRRCACQHAQVRIQVSLSLFVLSKIVLLVFGKVVHASMHVEI